jgi:4-hydroxy-2-oxoheptanedioate aldolase
VKAGVNRIRQRIHEGRTAFAVGMHLREPAIVEMIGLAGFDAVFIDMENSALELREVEEMIRAADVVGMSANVRIPQLDDVLIRRVLDLGAHAVTIPHVQTSEQAERIVRAARYHPVGERGVTATSRAAQYGMRAWAEYARAANDDNVVSLEVEDRYGVENIESLAAVRGVDLVAIGPSDLAESLGIREPEDPRLRAVVQDIANKVQRVGNAKMGFPANHRMLAATADDLRNWRIAYSNVGPMIETVLRIHFSTTLATLRAGE